ncbi:MAG TPA: putative lipid II flippase FtsW [Candidatus Eisenbacteria bacterium]|nr:putative lipid II flippase FtsW [Candidatus Eisenbacteria bacterium]
MSLRGGDRWLLVLTIALLCAGLAMVLSASSVWALQQHGSAYYYFVRQLVFAGAGVAGMAVLMRVDYRHLHRWAPAAAVTVTGLMLLVLVPHVGLSIQGARRWIDVGPLGTVQPSEAAKLVLAIYLAQWVDRRQGRLRSFGDGFLPFAIMTAAFLVILMLQRDLGTAVVMSAILLSIYFAGGGRKRHVALLLGTMVVAFVLLIVLESYRQQRLETFLDPFKDPLGASYQPMQALIGLGSGGLFGVGLGHSVQKYLWLPEAHTDFIFAIIGEETGLVGTTAVLAGFVLLTVRGYRVALRAPDRFGVMLATGITTWVGFQALVNMGTVTSTLPATGVPLPFISSGGSALAITLTAMGVLLNISAQAQEAAPTSRRTDATADLGRRNWRSPFASARRRPGVPRRAAGG